MQSAFVFFVVQCEQLVEISKALGAPSHILMFIREYYRGIQVCTVYVLACFSEWIYYNMIHSAKKIIFQRQDILKAKFFSSDTGMSPANFFITHQFMDTVSAQSYLLIVMWGYDWKQVS